MVRSTLRIAVSVVCMAAVAAAPATAVEQVPASPAACEHGSGIYTVSKGKRTHKVTHVSKVKVAPKKTRTVTKPALVIRTIKAGASGTGDFDAAAILTAAHGKYLKNEDAVRAPGDRTGSDPADVGRAKLRNPTTQPREYAGFEAATVWRGTWILHHCGDSAVHAKGTWRTFGSVKVSGYALCPASRYDAAAAAAQACRQVWS